MHSSIKELIEQAHKDLQENRAKIIPSPPTADKNPAIGTAASGVMINFGTPNQKLLFLKQEFSKHADLRQIKNHNGNNNTSFCIPPPMTNQIKEKQNTPMTIECNNIAKYPERYDVLPDFMVKELLHEINIVHPPIEEQLLENERRNLVKQQQEININNIFSRVVEEEEDGEYEEQEEEERRHKVLKEIEFKTSTPITKPQFFVEVDSHFTLRGEVTVYNFKGMFFSATLNYTNIEENGNRFYILQVLQFKTNPQMCYYYLRRGRTGEVGRTLETGPMPIELAVNRYTEKIQERLLHGYKLLKVDPNKTLCVAHARKEVPSRLPPSVQELMRLLFDVRAVENQLQSIGFDCKQMPLGKVNPEFITRGYYLLKQILIEIARIPKPRESIELLSAEFYKVIPHDFGRKKVINFVLDSETKVKCKIELLQSVEDASKMTNMIDLNYDSELNLFDAYYQQLGVEITSLEISSPFHSAITKYVLNTHADEHDNYLLEIQEIFEIKSKTYVENFNKDLPNHLLLWHGSRVSNFISILKSGLQIAPKEVPLTGAMFGKGIYFADMVSKAANYCVVKGRNSIGCLLLCEVALGQSLIQYQADGEASMKCRNEFQSVRALGRKAPSSGETIENVFVPNTSYTITGISDVLESHSDSFEIQLICCV